MQASKKGVIARIIDWTLALEKYVPRLSGWALISLILLAGLAVLRAEQLPVVLYKLSLVTLGAVLGYWIDRRVFPYCRPHTQIRPHGSASYDAPPPLVSVPAALVMLRRVFVIAACILGLTLGL